MCVRLTIGWIKQVSDLEKTYLLFEQRLRGYLQILDSRGFEFVGYNTLFWETFVLRVGWLDVPFDKKNYTFLSHEDYVIFRKILIDSKSRKFSNFLHCSSSLPVILIFSLAFLLFFSPFFQVQSARTFDHYHYHYFHHLSLQIIISS